MAEPLGDLTRTHTCGALRPSDVGADAVLLGWVHRVRDLGGVTFIDIRDRAGHVAGRRARQRRADGGGQAAAPEFVVGVQRHASSGDPTTRSTRSSRPAKSKCWRARSVLLNEAKTPPFQIAEDVAGVRGRAAALPLPRPAPAAAAAQHRAAPPRDVGGPAVLRRAGLLGDRDADPDEVDARRRARLSGAEPGALRASSTRCRSRRRSSSRS